MSAVLGAGVIVVNPAPFYIFLFGTLQARVALRRKEGE